MTSRGQRCTVIVRSKNSEHVIGQTLSSLFSQDHDDFDLLVVDSGSTDGTLDIVARFEHSLMRVEPADYFPGAVLNSAIELANADILVFLNSDCVPLTPNSLGRLLAAFDDPEVQAAFARQVPRPGASAWVRREYAMSFPESGDPPEWITLSLPFAAMRKSAWERHRFYTDAWGSEDTEWGHWARTCDQKVRYVADSTVMHSHDYTVGQMYGRRFIEGEADAFIYGRADSILDAASRALGRTARDIITAVAAREWRNAFIAPVRCTAGSFAYNRGNRLGMRRKASGDTDAALGHRVALKHHESRGPES